MAYQRNGYWYRSKRKGGAVVTEYLGRAECAGLVADVENWERAEREIERAEAREAREAVLELDREIDALGDLNRKIVGAVLVVSGYHSHKRQWRRQRHVTTDC